MAEVARVIAFKIESFYECRVSSLLLQREGEGGGKGRARAHTHIHTSASQTVEITHCSRFSRERNSSPRVSNPWWREIRTNFLFTRFPVACFSRRDQIEAFETPGFKIAVLQRRGICGECISITPLHSIYHLLTLLFFSPFYLSIKKERKEREENHRIRSLLSHRCSKMKITITSLCSRIVRITRRWWRRRNRWAQLWFKYTPRTGTIRTTEVFNHLLYILFIINRKKRKRKNRIKYKEARVNLLSYNNEWDSWCTSLEPNVNNTSLSSCTSLEPNVNNTSLARRVTDLLFVYCGPRNRELALG